MSRIYDALKKAEQEKALRAADHQSPEAHPPATPDFDQRSAKPPDSGEPPGNDHPFPVLIDLGSAKPPGGAEPPGKSHPSPVVEDLGSAKPPDSGELPGNSHPFPVLIDLGSARPPGGAEPPAKDHSFPVIQDLGSAKPPDSREPPGNGHPFPVVQDLASAKSLGSMEAPPVDTPNPGELPGKGHLFPVVEDLVPAKSPGGGEPPAVNLANRGEPGWEAILVSCREEPWGLNPGITDQVDARSQALVSEEFDSLRLRLSLMRKGQSLHKLLVTSPLPQEGRTFVAASLARVMAKQPDCRVLLIDADLRMPALHLALGASSTPGLSDYLQGTAELASILQRGSANNFFFIPAGNPAVNPAELVSNGRFETLLGCLGPAFEWIIIDSPAVIPVSDARQLAGFCDGVILLVNAGTTPFDLAQRASGEFPREQLLGVILNRADQTHASGAPQF